MTRVSPPRMEKILAISFRPRQYAFGTVDIRKTDAPEFAGNFFNCLLMQERIAHDSALPYLFTTNFKLRFHENKHF